MRLCCAMDVLVDMLIALSHHHQLIGRVHCGRKFRTIRIRVIQMALHISHVEIWHSIPSVLR